MFSQSLRQRCVIHRARNVLAKVPAHAQAQVKADFWAIFDLPDGTAPGDAAVAEATRRAKAFSTKWAKLYPSAVECLNDDFAHLVTYLRFPAELLHVRGTGVDVVDVEVGAHATLAGLHIGDSGSRIVADAGHVVLARSSKGLECPTEK